MFKGKKVFITGASRGIGKQIAKQFEKAGAIVNAPTRAQLDLADGNSVQNYLNREEEQDYSILIFCAGVNPKNEIENMTMQDVYDTFQVNVFSSMQIIKHFVSKLKRKNGVKVVFITSLYSFVSKEGRIPYASSKHAITGLVKTLALELAPYDICVNAVAPGYVMTEMTKKNLSEQEIEAIKSMIPTGRFQDPGEIADAVMFLASDNNRSITGQTLVVDGGFLCR